MDFIPNAAEDEELFLFASFRMGGIIEREMMTIPLPRKMGAGLIGIPADGDDRLHFL